MDDERTLAELSEQTLDDLDLAHLDALRHVHELVDPVPADLVERVHFALALDEMYDEVARMTRMPMDALAVRGEQAVERTETLTFSADRLTAMVTVTRVEPGRLRLDGWIAPPAVMRVGLRRQDGEELEVRSDDTGRFSIDGLAEGFAQLSFRSGDAGDAGDEPAHAVVTPLFQL